MSHSVGLTWVVNTSRSFLGRSSGPGAPGCWRSTISSQGWVITHVIAIDDQEEILATASHLNNDSQTVVLEPVNGRFK